MNPTAIGDTARELADRLHATYHASTLQPEHPVVRAVRELRAQAGVIEGLQATSRVAGRAIRDAQLQIARLTDAHARVLEIARENGTERDRARRQRDQLAVRLGEVLAWYIQASPHADDDAECVACQRVREARQLLEEVRT